MICSQNDIQNTNRNKQTGIQSSHSVVSDSLRPHGLQHARPPCPSPTPRVYPNSCPSSWWCYPTITSCFPLLLLSSIFPTIRGFSNESALHIRWPKYWSFSFNIMTITMHLINKISSQRIQNKNHVHTIHIKVKSDKTNLLICCLATGQWLLLDVTD